MEFHSPLALHFQQFRSRAMARRLSSSTSSSAGSNASNRFSAIPSLNHDTRLDSASRATERMQKSRSALIGSEADSYSAAAGSDGAWPLRCAYVVRELIQTERTYVQALDDVVKGYIKPLMSHLFLMVERPSFIQTVFSNIIKIHRLHVDFLRSLESGRDDPQLLAEVFGETDFHLYTEYCTNYSRGNEYLERALTDDEELREFFEECQHNLGHSLPINSYLIKPVQRILKYPLLLEEIVKHFGEHHSACASMKDASSRMNTVAEEINAAFKGPKVKRQVGPRSIAKRRSREARDLQKSRSSSLQRSASIELGDCSRVEVMSKKLPPKGSRYHHSMDCLNQTANITKLPTVNKLKSFFENLSTGDTIDGQDAAVVKPPATPSKPSSVSSTPSPSSTSALRPRRGVQCINPERSLPSPAPRGIPTALGNRTTPSPVSNLSPSSSLPPKLFHRKPLPSPPSNSSTVPHTPPPFQFKCETSLKKTPLIPPKSLATPQNSQARAPQSRASTKLTHTLIQNDLKKQLTEADMVVVHKPYHLALPTHS